ncbi:hypothetical protein [Agreia sp. VKM Ac-1783]|uniref:hypothetical protein n=1 Tax=Agreia sp. VKM Ac-1783 TaxID=1938889 RepID=UPI000A2AC701|nr:hypothetical protein [Agreia sp. VKM Ac-1783]SMQ71280.1 hypothetical protein SAMN06295943_2212 [Agreia sp. VKM Ac-1783]
MINDETSRQSDSPDDAGDEARDRQAAADWIADRAAGENITTDIDGTVTAEDAATSPDPDAYGHAETDTLAVEDHEPASRDYPRPDPHGGITQADRQI